MIPRNLLALETKISAILAVKPECFITHPTELAVLKQMSPRELEQFALDHGWRTVSRVGGRQIEFYNDVSARLDHPQTARRRRTA
jgi:hypothetical protein